MKTFRAIWSTIKKPNRVLRRRLMVDIERNALRFHWNAARGEWLFTLTQSSSFSTEVSNSAKPLKTNILRCWVYSQNLARVVAVKWERCKNNPACPCVPPQLCRVSLSVASTNCWTGATGISNRPAFGLLASSIRPLV